MKKAKRMKIMTKITLSLFATVLSAAVLAADLVANATGGAAALPPIKDQAPTDSSRDVRIHFYIDAHKSMLPGDAYKRAANGLRMMLGDIANPIKKGLRDRMVGERVEVNTGTAYLIKPKEIVPFSLSGDAVLPKVKAESGKWDLDSLVQMILDGPEKQTKNIVVCVISNDPNLKHSHGVFHEEKERGLVFFVLWADPKECVGAGKGWIESMVDINPYWSAKDWEAFLQRESGMTANDIANAIVDRYYKLTEKEMAGLSAITCEAREREIFISRIRSLPEKDMWKSTLTLNGKQISMDKDEDAFDPELGQNKVVASMVSPTGLSYTRIWDTKDFVYYSLEADRNLLNEAKALLKLASEHGLLKESDARELKDAVDNPNALRTDDAMQKLRKRVSDFQKKVWLKIGMKKLSVRIENAEKLLTDIKSLDKKGEYGSDCKRIGESLKKARAITEKSGATEIESAIQDMDKVIENLNNIKRKLQIAINLKKGYEDLIAAIDKREKDVKAEEVASGMLCANIADLAAFRKDAKEALDTENASKLKEIDDDFSKPWKPVYVEKAGHVSNLVTVVEIKGLIRELQKSAAKREVAELVDLDKLIDLDALEKEIEKLDASKNQNRQVEIRDRLKNAETVFVSLSKMRPKVVEYIDGRIKGVKEPNKVKNMKALRSCKKAAENAKNIDELRSAYLKAKEWEPKKSGGGFGIIVGALLLVAVVGLGIAYFLKAIFGRPVAVVSFETAGSTEGPIEVELKKNTRINFADRFKCATDIRVVCKKDDAGGADVQSLKFFVTSPNKKVWLLKMAGDEKKLVAEKEVDFEDGTYQLFDNEYAMSSVGTIKFELKID